MVIQYQSAALMATTKIQCSYIYSTFEVRNHPALPAYMLHMAPDILLVAALASAYTGHRTTLSHHGSPWSRRRQASCLP